MRLLGYGVFVEDVFVKNIEENSFDCILKEQLHCMARVEVDLCLCCYLLVGLPLFWLGQCFGKEAISVHMDDQ